MRENLTEIVFILDRSGSMSGLESDTIGGFNSFIENQRKEEGEARITTVLFDNKYELLHNGIDLKDVQPLTEEEYYTRGMTALLDAVGKTIIDIGVRLKSTPEVDRPSKVIFIITTDGYENSSREFSQSKIKEMINHQKEKYNWEFIFLGADIDSAKAARDIGISHNRASNFIKSKRGINTMYDVVSKNIITYRKNGKIDDDWDKDIQK